MASQIGRNGAGICFLFLIETVAMGMLSIPLHVFFFLIVYMMDKVANGIIFLVKNNL